MGCEKKQWHRAQSICISSLLSPNISTEVTAPSAPQSPSNCAGAHNGYVNMPTSWTHAKCTVPRSVPSGPSLVVGFQTFGVSVPQWPLSAYVTTPKRDRLALGAELHNVNRTGSRSGVPLRHRVGDAGNGKAGTLRRRPEAHLG